MRILKSLYEMKSLNLNLPRKRCRKHTVVLVRLPCQTTMISLSKVMCHSCLSSGEDFWSGQPPLFAMGKTPLQLASLLRGQPLARMIGKMYQSRSAKLFWPANGPGLYLFGDTRLRKSCLEPPYSCRRLVGPGGLSCVSLTTSLCKWLHTGEWVWEGNPSVFMAWFSGFRPPMLYGHASKHSTMGRQCSLVLVYQNLCCQLMFSHAVFLQPHCAPTFSKHISSKGLPGYFPKSVNEPLSQGLPIKSEL